MKATLRRVYASAVLAGLSLAGAAGVHADDPNPALRDVFDQATRYSQAVDFPARVGDLGNSASGQSNFGIAADGISGDSTNASFGGFSPYAGNIVPNGRTCFSCHRPGAPQFGLPPLPLHDSVAPDDPLLTGISADIGTEPLGLYNFDQLGLTFHRPNRFNPFIPEGSPMKNLFFWRRTTRLLNLVFTVGFLGDGRSRELVETARGAVFTHTQSGDLRFDDLVAVQRLRDIARFMEDQIDPPELAALLDSTDPMYQTLVDNPFYTVSVTTPEQKEGQEIFRTRCMACHNTPNVFSNLDHIDAPPLSFPPHVGHPMDIGVAQRNALNLEFRQYNPQTGQREPITIPLIREDGTVINYTVVDDVGVAGATGRYEDLHRFKIPQLRRISKLGPYFHDNSAQTLEDVVDYFNSDDYNNSADGSKYPIHMSAEQRSALLAFLDIL